MPSKASLADIRGGPGSRTALSLQIFVHSDQHESHQLSEESWETQLSDQV